MRIAILLTCTLAWSICAAQPIDAFPQLRAAEEWSAGGPQAANLKVDSQGDALEVTFDAAPGAVADLLLKTPVAIPEGTDDLSFLLSGQVEASQLGLDVIFEDAKGVQWYARTKLPGANEYHGALGVVNTGQLKGRTVRVSVPAFSQPSNGRFYRTSGNGIPPYPWKWIGLRFLGDRQPHHKDAPTVLYLRGFALAQHAVRTSEYTGIRAELSGKPTAYAGRRVEFCEELDGRPGVALFDMYSGAGTYQVRWELFKDYAGPPAARGDGVLQAEVGADALPLPLQMARQVDFPRLPRGTYWVRWRAHYFPNKAAGAPAGIIDGQERLYIHESRVADDLQAAEPRPGWLTVRPIGRSFVASAPEEMGLNVSARREGSADGWKVRYAVTTPHLRTKVAEGTLTLEFGENGLGTARVDLSQLAPGAYRAEIELLANGGVLDRQDVLIGRKNTAQSSGPLAKLPEGVLDWQQALKRKEPYFHLSPMWHSATWAMEGRNRWYWFENFLNQAATVSRDIEYETPWSILEPLPGVYDWEEMDKFLAKSRELGLQVLVWPGFWGEEPAWLPSVPTQAADGRVFFDFVYDFYGARQDYANAPELQDALLGALRSVVDHTRDHPAVQGYFLIQELPADAPFMNWMSGYGERERIGYRAAMEKRFPDLAELGKRWGREVKAFSEIEPPTEKASDREWLDWLDFRGGSYDAFMGRLLTTVREMDPFRPVFVYGDLFGISLRSSDFPEQGFAKANGGSHDAIHPFSISQIGLNGVLQRTEDHWPGKWTGYFPEVLDASVFAMSYGGGLGMNCKHYLFTYLPELGKDRLLKFDDLRKPPYSLDRFEKFMPIWSAMRPADRMPVEIQELLDTEAGLLTNKTLNRNGLWDGEAQMACYRAQVNFGAEEFPGVGKARLMLMIKSHLGTLTRERMEQIKAYVAAGGSVLMLPEVGRKCVEEPGADWVLLRELGFAPPQAVDASETLARPVGGQQFAADLTPFAIRRAWPHVPNEGEAIVAVGTKTGVPALTWRPFGKGKVAVAWTEKLPPRGMDGPRGNVLKAVSHWAGIEDVMAADNPAFWMNMMHDAGTGRFFGLAHAGQFLGKPTGPTKGAVRYRLPDGKKYRVTELISGNDIGVLDGGEIWNKGIPLSLTPRQVAIFQFSPE